MTPRTPLCEILEIEYQITLAQIGGSTISSRDRAEYPEGRRLVR